MTDDTFWKVFTDTGDPMCWLMCRAADRNPPKSSEDKNGRRSKARALRLKGGT